MKNDHPALETGIATPEHKHMVDHVGMHEANGHVHHHEHYGVHKADHMKHHEHVKKMCGGGMGYGKKAK